MQPQYTNFIVRLLYPLITGPYVSHKGSKDQSVEKKINNSTANVSQIICRVPDRGIRQSVVPVTIILQQKQSSAGRPILDIIKSSGYSYLIKKESQVAAFIVSGMYSVVSSQDLV